MVNSEERKQIELFEAFHDENIHGLAVKNAIEERRRLAKINLYYDTDDIFRREIDHLKTKMKKDSKKNPDKIDTKIEELLREAEYRRYIACFENMEINYQSRKEDMVSPDLKKAFGKK